MIAFVSAVVLVVVLLVVLVLVLRAVAGRRDNMNRVLRVLTFREAEAPAALRVQVREIQEHAWPSDDARAAADLGPVHDPVFRPLSLLLVDDTDRVLSALDVLFKQIEVGSASLAAAGLSTVVSAPAERGHGHGSKLVTHAREALLGLGVDVGLFTCDRRLGSFYSRCGWELLPGTVLVGGTREEPFPSDQPGFDKVALGGSSRQPGSQHALHYWALACNCSAGSPTDSGERAGDANNTAQLRWTSLK